MVDPENNLAMISLLSGALEELSDDVVFVGGSVVALYIDKIGTPEPAPSVDIDCVVEVLGYGDYGKLQERLRSKGFKDLDPEDEAEKPTCRMYYNRIKVDFLPTKEDVLGYTNPFYQTGISKKIKVKLPDKTEVFILPIESYLATKFKAFFDRGIDDPLTSQDLEDIVAILDGKKDLPRNIIKASPEESKYLKEAISKWLGDWDIIYREAVEANLP